MLKDKFNLFLLILTILYIIIYISNVEKETDNYFFTKERAIAKNKLENFFTKLDEKKDTNIHWGIEKKIKQLQQVPTKEESKLKLKDNNTICLDNSCYKFIGIFEQNNVLKASFYLPDKKDNKILSYSVNATIENKLKILDIQQSFIKVQDISGLGTLEIKLFNIDITKYQPKGKAQ